MKTYSKKLEELLDSVEAKLLKLIDKKGTESEHFSDKSLKIKEDDLMYNLEGGRYLTEITRVDGHCELVDNNGYRYYYSALETEKFLKVADHLIAVNK